MLNIGIIFKKKRTKDKKTLDYIANRIGLSLGYLSQFENNTTNISLEKLRRCVLGYELSEEEREKLRQIIIPAQEKKPEHLNDKEALLFYQLADLPQEVYEKVINEVNKRNLRVLGGGEKTKD